MACELELEINKLNKQSRDMRVKKALENAAEHVPHIVEWLTTAKKDSENEKSHVSCPVVHRP
jgi:hypothetical protein